ncbi:ABC transporter substrate-binding protein [Legionella israelensis]|uniref:Extracellular solute-binding protein n=1 Tax=Legionella israelensis TaxID=454 RepID=A0A0W0WMY7_9GAMM|nr:ABC transporter substrate-binding protein [Legionella israelensis]KTD33619.1 extracellular solute-binding protein [Legionella israelensis]QBS08799.1 peptide ABC transporter substrate-binding protein [Legionella israelensis]SCY12609.1 ABC-type oligopeptide transport system, substrate-binding protein [Legionella israelensis DSM 19235]STX58477.1 extracellular solute-binding protein [Legionella israelensis]
MNFFSGDFRQKIKYVGISLAFLSTISASAFSDQFVWNNPYTAKERDKSIYYNSFSEQPKTLDPARSYSANEYIFIAQICEPPLQYDYLKRPYQLTPLTAQQLPEIRYLNKEKKKINLSDNDTVAYSVYTIKIKPGIMYQPHPAFARYKSGTYRYHDLPEGYLEEQNINQISDFKYSGTRELKVDDYIYEIKRLANPAVSSPIFGLMSEYILGFKKYGASLPLTYGQKKYIDLRAYPMEGLKKIDDYTFEVTLKGQYAQFIFWLAMPFFAPVPWEVDRFYSQPPMDDKNLTLDWYPVGTGPFMLSENNPNRRMVLDKNPHFRLTFFPTDGSEEDRKKGYLKYAGKRIPLIEKTVFTLEKESIPRWNKFLQGYYDSSGITADSFDQAIQINRFGTAVLTPAMKDKKIRLTQTIEPSIYYMGFNMLDPVIGGQSERARKLRLAISIAMNYEEFIAIFFNGRGKAAQGPIPPGIFGYKEGKAGINSYVFKWVEGMPRLRPIEDARQLMREAGYPGGVNPKTGRHLILHYDVPATGGPDDKAQLGWVRKQFARIGISLNIRATQYNRFQEKMRSGNAQIFSWGWNADYPDPENFLFLLYGPNGKVKHGGENAANYANSQYDKLFEQMKNMENNPKRQALIDQMVSILRYDAPWVWGINPKNFVLTQQWVSPIKPNSIAQNTLKYVAIDVPLRNELRARWNQPVLWPLVMLVMIFFVLLFLLFLAYRKKQRRSVSKVEL